MKTLQPEQSLDATVRSFRGERTKAGQGVFQASHSAAVPMNPVKASLHHAGSAW